MSLSLALFLRDSPSPPRTVAVTEPAEPAEWVVFVDARAPDDGAAVGFVCRDGVAHCYLGVAPDKATSFERSVRAGRQDVSRLAFDLDLLLCEQERKKASQLDALVADERSRRERLQRLAQVAQVGRQALSECPALFRAQRGVRC